MDDTKNENNIVAVFQTNESAQSEVNGEMDNTHGVVILPNENLKTAMENSKRISNPLHREILSDEDNIPAVFPTNENVQPELNDTQSEMGNTGVVILANMSDIWVKLQPKPRDLTKVLDYNKELHHEVEDDGICETRKTNFVSPTSEERQADVWTKAGDPLSNEGFLTGRWNKAGVPYAEEETPTERGNKGGVLSSEEESLLVQQDGCSKERISCKNNVACVNTESVLIHDVLEDLQDASKEKCTGIGFTSLFYCVVLSIYA